MVMKFHGNVRGGVRVIFLALSDSKPHSFICGAVKLSGNCSHERSLEHRHSHAFWSLKEGVGEGLAEKVGKGLAKGWQGCWRRVGGGLADFLAPSNFGIPEATRLETRVCDFLDFPENFQELPA